MEITGKSSFRPRIVPIRFGEYSSYCRIMTGSERDDWIKYIQSQANLEATPESIGLFFSRLVARCLCDSDGKAVFDSPEEVNAVIDAASLEDAFKAIGFANRLGKEGVDEEKKS